MKNKNAAVWVELVPVNFPPWLNVNSLTWMRKNRIDLLSILQLLGFQVLLYKIKNKPSPLYLRRLLPQACSTSSHYHLRGHNFPVPTVRSSRTLKAFLPRSIILWNDLPPDIQALRTVASFKAALKKHLKLQIHILLYCILVSFFVFIFFTFLLFLFLLSFASICIFIFIFPSLFSVVAVVVVTVSLTFEENPPPD